MSSASLKKVKRHSAGIEIDADQVAAANLSGGDQVRERMHQVAVDGALQVAGAVLQVGAFAQQVVRGAIGQREDERRAVGRVEDALLHDVQARWSESCAVPARPAAGRPPSCRCGS